MMQTIEANWVALAVAVLAVVLIGWLLLRRASKAPPRREYQPDVLDQGASSVQRNQALIDAAPAAQIVPPAFGGAMGGLAEAVAVGAQDVVEEAEAATPPPPPPPPPPAPAPEIEPAPQIEPAPAPLPEIEPSVEPIPAPIPPTAAETEAAGEAELIYESRPQKPEEEPLPHNPEPEPQPGQTPVPEPQPGQPVNPGGSAGDDLSRIKGLGPKLQALLPTLGLSTYEQIAALSEADLAALDAKLGAFAGRPAKDNWIEQARFLASGDVGAFEARFGKV